MGGEIMNEDQVRQFEQNAEVQEHRTDQVELVGEDHGAKRVLSTMNFAATDARGYNLSMEDAERIAAKHFEIHCSQIGWWPSGEYPDVMVKRREDGTYFASAFLKESTKRKIIGWEEFPRIGVNTQTDDDIHTGDTSSTLP